MIKAIALDDEPIALDILETLCGKVSSMELVKIFTKVSDAKKYISRYPIDLIFLDINMPSMNGLEFYKSLSQQMMVIFTTAYSEFAVEGFELNAIDYLLKPISFERLEQAIARANEYQNLLKVNKTLRNEEIYIRADYQLTKIVLQEIELIESFADYIKIKLVDNKHITVRMTMKAFQNKLPTIDFIRVHRSFIIPVRRIQMIRNKVIYLDNMEIQIGSSFEREVAQRFNEI